MARFNRLPAWTHAVVVAVAVAFIFRYAAAIESGVGHTVAIRTYAFWALVCMPVAVLADTLVRTTSNYRVVQLAVARIKSRG